MLSTMVSFAPAPYLIVTAEPAVVLPDVFAIYGVIVGPTAGDGDIAVAPLIGYAIMVLVSEDGSIVVNVGAGEGDFEGLAPTELASEAKRTKDRGIFKAKRKATLVSKAVP